MKLLPMHYSATCGGSAAASQAGGFPWDRSPCRAQGSRGAADGSRGCGMEGSGRAGVRGSQGDGVGTGWSLARPWGGEGCSPQAGAEKKTSERIHPADKRSETERRGEEKRALCIGVCLTALSGLSKSHLCFALLSPSLGPCTRLLLCAVPWGLCFPPGAKRPVPCSGTGGDSGGGAANHLSCCFALIVAK